MATSTEATPAVAVQRLSASGPGAWSNAYLLSSGDETLLFDVFQLASDATQLADAIDATGQPLTKVWISHAHPDHFLQLDLILDRFPEIEVLTTPNVAADLRADGPWMFDLRKASSAPRRPNGWSRRPRSIPTACPSAGGRSRSSSSAQARPSTTHAWFSPTARRSSPPTSSTTARTSTSKSTTSTAGSRAWTSLSSSRHSAASARFTRDTDPPAVSHSSRAPESTSRPSRLRSKRETRKALGRPSCRGSPTTTFNSSSTCSACPPISQRHRQLSPRRRDEPQQNVGGSWRESKVSPTQLASGEDRARAELALRDNYAQGRLPLDELTARTATVQGGRTIGELRSALRDLPGDPWAVAEIVPAPEDHARTGLILALTSVLVPLPPLVLGLTAAALGAITPGRGGVATGTGRGGRGDRRGGRVRPTRATDPLGGRPPLARTCVGRPGRSGSADLTSPIERA